MYPHARKHSLFSAEDASSLAEVNFSAKKFHKDLTQWWDKGPKNESKLTHFFNVLTAPEHCFDKRNRAYEKLIESLEPLQEAGQTPANKLYQAHKALLAQAKDMYRICRQGKDNHILQILADHIARLNSVCKGYKRRSQELDESFAEQVDLSPRTQRKSAQDLSPRALRKYERPCEDPVFGRIPMLKA